jgi:hypothetical protein
MAGWKSLGQMQAWLVVVGPMPMRHIGGKQNNRIIMNWEE